MLGLFSINLLKCIAAIVNVWLITIRKVKGQKILNFAENYNTLGWLHKSSFNPLTHFAHDKITENMAKILLEADSTLHSQHIIGKINVISDSLSQHMHIDGNTLTYLLKSIFPSQVLQKI